MRRACWGVALGVVCVAWPGRLAAQLNPRAYCLTPGQCYAAAFAFTDYLTDPVPYTLFSVYLQNLQGSFAGSSPGTYGLNLFTLYFLNQESGAGDPDGVVRHVGAAGAAASAAGPIEQRTPSTSFYHDLSFGRFARESFWLQSNIGYGVLGCTIPPYLTPSDWTHRMCPREGLSGWLRLDFRIRGRDYTRSIQDPTPVSTRFSDFAFGFGWSANSCYLGHQVPHVPGTVGNCTEHDYNAFVTPEPATLGLVALGLAGVAGMRRRRQRTNRAPVS